MNKRKHPVAFSTTIFPIDESYIADFFSSLDKQTCRNFDLVILNDDYGCLDKYRERFPHLSIVELIYSDVPAANREHALNTIKQMGYEIVVFGDIDDTFDSDRVRKSVAYLQEFDVVVNDVSLFDEHGVFATNYMSNRIDNNTVIDKGFVRDKNIFGLSNTAIRLSLIDTVQFDRELIALDWYLFACLLEKEASALFTSEIVTYYRQHEVNTVGLKKFSVDSIKRIFAVKYKHYQLMSKIDPIYIELFEDMNKTLIEIENSSHLRALVDRNNQIVGSPLWWECIK
jgi:hypothetical protein